MSLSEIIGTIISNRLILQVILYLLLGTLIWLIYFSLLKKFASNNINFSIHTGEQHKSCELHPLGLIVAIVVLLSIMLYAINYVGYLPYEPDTSSYPNLAQELKINGHYNGGNNTYYSVYHTSLVILFITSVVSGSMEISYAILLSAFLISLILISSIELSRLYGASRRLLALVLALLFVATPPIFGFDLIQQYVASAYAIIGVVLLLPMSSMIDNDYRRLTIFVLFASISIVTHLTPIILVIILAIAYFILLRKRIIKEGILAFLLIGTIYTLYLASNTQSIVISLFTVFTSMIHGTIAEPTIRAYESAPTGWISLLAWTLLPSMSIAFVLLGIVITFKNLLKRNNSFRKAECLKSEYRLNIFSNLILFLALFLMTFSLISKLIQLDIARYIYLPTYFMMLIIASASISRVLSNVQTRRRLLFIILLLVLIPYFYAALNDPYRLPQTGGLRLAPVTYTDRLEMVPLSCYGIDGYYVYGWHDVEIPFSCNTPHFKGGGSYYPILDILLNVAKDERVSIPQNSYLIIRKEVVVSQQLENYNIVFSGNEHLVLTPKP